jgi:hypothetical protein
VINIMRARRARRGTARGVAFVLAPVQHTTPSTTTAVVVNSPCVALQLVWPVCVWVGRIVARLVWQRCWPRRLCVWSPAGRESGFGELRERLSGGGCLSGQRLRLTGCKTYCRFAEVMGRRYWSLAVIHGAVADIAGQENGRQGEWQFSFAGR